MAAWPSFSSFGVSDESSRHLETIVDVFVGDITLSLLLVAPGVV